MRTKSLSRSPLPLVCAALIAAAWVGCSSDTDPQGAGGKGGSSGSASGSSGSGGQAAGKAGAGGAAGKGGGVGKSAGAAGEGGNGASAGEGTSGEGAGEGGGPSDAGRGGAAAGTGGATGGVGGAPFSPPFMLGADVSSVQEGINSFRDTDGVTKTIFDLLKNHGFNYIRLKTFVDPWAPYGYAASGNGCAGLEEPFGDSEHVIEFGRQAKAAGMGFFLNFHYSDVWADPGNQIIPAAWRDATTVTELASHVKAYTKDVLTRAVAAGARPDMVQVGNEITPGMLAHVPGPTTDCWGNNPSPAPAAISGSISNWDNLATLLKAGIEGVREVDPRIQVMLHVENTRDLAGVRRWVDNALMRDVEFDVLGLSCYVNYQGVPSVWENTFAGLATSYPELKFAIAEYNPERTEANRIMKALPDGRGLGTFFWEPTRDGEWGGSLFGWQGGVATANSADFAEFDALRIELGL
jgi:arabinogalactan endo-1,4-beta-galactosidase